MAKRPDLTYEQRTLIKVLYKDLGQDADQIREHESLKRPDGSKILKKTVLHWIDRIEQTGDVKPKSKKGRNSLLDDNDVRELVRLVDHNPNEGYKKILQLAKAECPGRFKVSRRTINRHASRNNCHSFKAIKRPYLDDKGKDNRTANSRKMGDEFLKDVDARERAKNVGVYR